MLESLKAYGRGLRRRTVLAALCCLPALLLAGCATPSLPLPERPDIPFGEGRIWQVDKSGLEPSYLFGTIHRTDPRLFELPKAAETAFERAQIAAFEVELGIEPSDAETEAYARLPAGDTLKSVLGATYYNRLRNLSFFRYFELEAFDRLQPWVIWLLVADREIDTGLKRDPGNAVLDDWLQQRAIDDDKEIVALETWEEQINIFAGMPMEDQASMLRSAIDSYYEPRTEVNNLRLYLDGDLAMSYALWQRFLDSMEPAVAQRFHNRIGTTRNRNMVERLMPVFARGSTFVVVGVMHMPGEDGLLRLLEQQGYAVTRLE